MQGILYDIFINANPPSKPFYQACSYGDDLKVIKELGLKFSEADEYEHSYLIVPEDVFKQFLENIPKNPTFQERHDALHSKSH